MGRDRISELPDHLLAHILSYLPTKDSVKTSVLSKRWEFLWLLVPSLDLTVNDFNFPIFPDELFPAFIDGFLQSNRESRMRNFKIKYDDENSIDRFPEWIATAVARGVRHLHVETNMVPPNKDVMPQNIFKSNTLVSLKLIGIEIENLGSVAPSLPSLKILHLDDIWLDGDPLIIEKLVSGCPVLEDLTWIRPSDYYVEEVLFSLRVRSQSLKRFCFVFDNTGAATTDFSVEIDAPRLEYLSFRDNQSDRILLKNLSSLVTVDLDSEFNDVYGGSPLDQWDLRKRVTIRGFLTGVSSVRHMVVSKCTIEVLYRYSEFETIPKFDILYRLEATFSSSVLRFLPVFLESCPNLKSLILDLAVSTEQEEDKLTNVPMCLKMNLECVEMRGLTMEEGTWKELAKYFLENAAVLGKLILRFKDSVISNQDSDVSSEFLASSNLSRNYLDADFNLEYGGSPLVPEDLGKGDVIRDFLIGISSARHIFISEPTLEAVFSSLSIQLLPDFLKSCPFLKILKMGSLTMAMSFRNFVSQNLDSKFPAESGRYHLYISYACPWATRCLTILKLKGLDKAISFSSVQPLWRRTKENDEHMGWVFPDSDTEVPGAERDHVNCAKSIRELYDIASLNYTGKYTVPVLWDKKLKTIVNNESSEILKMFCTEFNHIAENPSLDLYPPNNRATIDEINEWINDKINEGVYKCGLTTTQAAYDEAVKQLFDALDKCEEKLEKQRFLCGNTLTETDLRLFATLIRFDEGYSVIFKCNKRLVREYPNLFNYTKDIFQMEGVSSTVKMDHVKKNYYGSFPSINPNGIIPHGPNIDYYLPHDRHRFSSLSSSSINKTPALL